MERTQKVAHAFSLFAPKPQSHEVPADAPEGSYTYALVKSAPDVPAEECERSAASVEILIAWGNAVLHVAHLTPPRSFHVGEADCDYCLPAEKIGVARMPVILAGPDGKVRAVIPPNASGTIEMAGESMTVQKAIATQKARPCADLPGAHEIELSIGAKAKIDLDGIVFQIAPVHAGPAVAGRAAFDTKSLAVQGLSAALHLGMLAAAAVLMPPLGGVDEGAISADHQHYIQQMIQATAEPEIDEAHKRLDPGTKDVAETASEPSRGPADPLATHAGPKNGPPRTAHQPDRLGPEMDRETALAVAKRFGMIEILNAMPSNPGAPPVPWGNIEVTDPSRSVLSSLWADDTTGPGGLDLTSLGEFGGPGGGVKAGPIRTVDGGNGDPNGIPKRHFAPPGHESQAPGALRQPLPTSEGTLPPDLVQRTVRQNFGRFRLCYQDGLRTNPALAGRVSVRFVIGRDGTVSSAGNGGSDLPDANVVSCVVRAFYGVSFPAPQNGIVRVTYPIVFSPG